MNNGDIIGKKFGKLKVLEVSRKEKKLLNGGRKFLYFKFYRCLCDCGALKEIRRNDLVSGRVNSCGCIKIITARQNTFKNLIGKKFGKLTVVKDSGLPNKSKRIIWECICDCGTVAFVNTRDMCSGNTSSCGCLKLITPQCFKPGSDHPKYNPKLSLIEREDRRLNNEYLEWRKNVYKKFNYKCVICSSNSNIHAHHLYAFLYYKELRYSVDNGVVLCESHHNNFHGKFGRGANTKEQFEEFMKSELLQ